MKFYAKAHIAGIRESNPALTVLNGNALKKPPAQFHLMRAVS
jgi:hypothetical protein